MIFLTNWQSVLTLSVPRFINSPNWFADVCSNPFIPKIKMPILLTHWLKYLINPPDKSEDWNINSPYFYSFSSKIKIQILLTDCQTFVSSLSVQRLKFCVCLPADIYFNCSSLKGKITLFPYWHLQTFVS